MARMLNERELQPILHDPTFMDLAIDALEAALIEFSNGQTQQHPWTNFSWFKEAALLRTWFSSSPTLGGALRMSSGLPGAPAADTKSVLLFSPDTGKLDAIIPDEEFNYIRTGAPAGVACRYLAAPETSVAGMLGSGKQARGQIYALQRGLPNLEEVRVYSPTPEKREGFAKEMSARLGLTVRAVNTPQEAVQGLSVVNLSTNSRSPVLETSWLQPGALVISIAPHQLPRDLIVGARVVLVSRDELLHGPFRREPFLTMIDEGAWSIDQVVGELGEVAAGKATARARPEDIVLVEAPGMAVWDLATARAVFQWAEERNIGSEFNLSAT